MVQSMFFSLQNTDSLKPGDSLQFDFQSVVVTELW